MRFWPDSLHPLYLKIRIKPENRGILHSRHDRITILEDIDHEQAEYESESKQKSEPEPKPKSKREAEQQFQQELPLTQTTPPAHPARGVAIFFILQTIAAINLAPLWIDPDP